MVNKNIKNKSDFKILLLYPNLSMLFSPPLSMAIFTAIFLKEGYQVLYGKYSGTEITLNDNEVLIMRESDILAKF